MIHDLSNAQRRRLVATYKLNTSSPVALLASISDAMAKQPTIDVDLARLLAIVASVDKKRGTSE